MVTCTATQNTLCNDYTALGNWIGLATGAPGTTATPSNEATGGGYARLQTSWSSGAISSGSSTSSGTAVTISVAAGTYTNMILASASATGAANMVDNCTITSVTMSASGQIVVTPTFSFT